MTKNEKNLLQALSLMIEEFQCLAEDEGTSISDCLRYDAIEKAKELVDEIEDKRRKKES